MLTLHKRLRDVCQRVYICYWLKFTHVCVCVNVYFSVYVERGSLSDSPAPIAVTTPGGFLRSSTAWGGGGGGSRIVGVG